MAPLLIPTVVMLSVLLIRNKEKLERSIFRCQEFSQLPVLHIAVKIVCSSHHINVQISFTAKHMHTLEMETQ